MSMTTSILSDILRYDLDAVNSVSKVVDKPEKQMTKKKQKSTNMFDWRMPIA